MLTRLSRIPHLFGKLTVTVCVVSGVLFSAWALRILSRTGHDPAALLGIVLAFFGGELALMFGKNAISGTKYKNKEVSYD